MVVLVVIQVAPLAHCAQVLRIAVLRRVVKVRDGQHHARASIRVRLSILGAAIWKVRAALASVSGALTNAGGDLLPVFRVARFVLGSYRHFNPPSACRRTTQFSGQFFCHRAHINKPLANFSKPRSSDRAAVFKQATLRKRALKPSSTTEANGVSLRVCVAHFPCSLLAAMAASIAASSPRSRPGVMLIDSGSSPICSSRNHLYRSLFFRASASSAERRAFSV